MTNTTELQQPVDSATAVKVLPAPVAICTSERSN